MNIDKSPEMLPEMDLALGGGNKPHVASHGNLRISGENGLVSNSGQMETGPYRVFLYLLDGNNHAATVNIPFFVN